jgi:hypothetical protein
VKKVGEARNTVFIDVPMEDVHIYGKDPRKWSEWFVNFHGPDKITGDGGIGTIIEARYSLIANFPNFSYSMHSAITPSRTLKV